MEEKIVLEIFFESRIKTLKGQLEKGVHRDVLHLVEHTLALNERLLEDILKRRQIGYKEPIRPRLAVR